MKKTRHQSQDALADIAANKLIDAHNEIIEIWFDRWAARERSKIDLAFKQAKASGTIRQPA